MNKFTLPILAAALSTMPAAGHAAAICVVKPITEASGKSVNLRLLLSSADAGEVLSLGFLPSACDGLDQHLPEYKAAVCKVAAFGNDAVQNRLTELLGVAPAKLCKSASDLLGQTTLGN